MLTEKKYKKVLIWLRDCFNMRAKEFIIEMQVGKIPKRQQQSTKGLNLYHDKELANSDYTMYRLMMAAAMSDGSGEPIDIDGKSWIGKQKSAHPYTDEEQEMLKQAYKAAGAVYQDLNHGDLKSQELSSTNNVSPVAKIKKNQYGV